jgi:hypothetical protein
VAVPLNVAELTADCLLLQVMQQLQNKQLSERERLEHQEELDRRNRYVQVLKLSEPIPSIATGSKL